MSALSAQRKGCRYGEFVARLDYLDDDSAEQLEVDEIVVTLP